MLKSSKLNDTFDEDDDLEDLRLQFKDYQFACNAMEEELIQKIELLEISIKKKNENKQKSKEKLKRALKEKDGEWKKKMEEEVKRKLMERDEKWKRKLKGELKRKDEQMKLMNEEWKDKEKQLILDIEQEKIMFSKKLEIACEYLQNNSNSIMKSTKGTLQESTQFNIFDPAHLGFRKDCGKIFISSFQERARIFHSYHISAILDLSSSKNKSQEIVVEAKYFLSIKMEDSPNNLNPNTIFEKGCNFILKAIQNKKNILIYCDLGLSRSPTMVMAFICSQMENFNEFDAQKFLQEKCNRSYSLRATLQTTLQNFCNHLKKRSKSNTK